MKKLVRFIAALAGLGTVIWVMRDRFISLALPREPEPPAFRVAPHPGPEVEPPPASADDLTVIKGIGPVYAARLEDAGVTTLAGLSVAEADTLAATVKVPADRVSKWIEEAAYLCSFQGS